MAKKASSPEWYLKVRTYKDATFVTVWLCHHDGAAESALLWGEVLPAFVDQIVEATGLPISRETMPYTPTPQQALGCLPVTKQAELFG